MPGRTHPARLPRYTASPVEPVVFDALRLSLPDGWVAWHSLRFAYGRHKNLREIDFVLLVPQRGLFLIEVKGGVDWRREDGHWYQGRRYVGPSGPLEQVLGANERLREMLSGELDPESVPFTRVVVCFPNMLVANKPSGGDLEDRVLTGGDFAELGARLRGMAQRAFPHESPALPWQRIHDVLHRTWGESWVPSLQLEKIRKLRGEELVRLDGQQRMLAQDTEVRGRLLVLGGPGTGKSLVAREFASLAAARGKKAAYLCFTRALANGVRRSGVRDARPIRDFALEMLRKNDIALPPGAPETWGNDEWNAMMDSAAELVCAADVDRPEVLVLDEVQDFGEREWAFVEGLAPAGVPLLAFGDASQQVLAHAVFDASRFHVKLELRNTYRVPEPLLELAATIRDGGRLRAPDSPHVRIERVGNHEAIADGVRRALKWLVERKVGASDIAVLSLASKRRMTPLPVGELIAGLPTAPADDEAAPDAVVIDTVIRFKGLERPWVVLIDVDETASPEGKTRAFIGITRATMGLVLVVT